MISRSRTGLPSASYESYNRLVKAAKIARVLRDFEMTAGVTYNSIPSAADQASIESLAGVQPASAITWGLAFLLYDDMVAQAASVAVPVFPGSAEPPKMSLKPRPAGIKVLINDADPPPPAPF